MKSRATNDYTNKLKDIIWKLSPEDGQYICKAIFRDPFTDIYSILLIIYVLILAGFLLWPFDFVSLVKNDARWIGNSTGIEFLKTGQAESKSSTREFYDRLVKGRGLTLEMWLKTEDLNQFGPARILSYSRDTGLRNFTVGQSREKLVFRLRTTETSLNGTVPHLIIGDIFNYRDLQHIVITYNFSEEKVYINGELRVQSKILKGGFSNWDPSCKLVIGNEATGDRPWKGKIYYIAIFNRPLTEQQIHQNYLAGPRHKTNVYPPDLRREGNTKYADLRANDPVARYVFDEGKGNVIHDSGSLSNPLNLYIPKYINHKLSPFLNTSIGTLESLSQFSDIIINILIFIPFGMLFHGMLRSRYGLTLKISLAVLVIGTLFSLGIESVQYFSITRNSSLIDVATNMTGTAIGIVMDRCYTFYLNYQAKHLEMLLYDRKEWK